MLELPGPLDKDAGRQLGLAGDDFTGLGNQVGRVTAADIHPYVITQESIFAFDRRGPFDDANVGNFRERNLANGRRTSG